MATRLVTLQPAQLVHLFRAVLATNTANNPKAGRYVDKAESRLAVILNYQQELDGSGQMMPPKDAADYEFGNDEIFGVKLALVQEITGVQNQRVGATHGMTKYTTLPIARAFGIEQLVRKESGLDALAEVPAELKFDDEAAE